MRNAAKALGAVAMAAALAFALAACGGTGQESSEEQYADQQFIADLGKALEARWDITDSFSGASETTDEEKERKSKAVEAELSRLEGYTSAKFEDSALQEKIIKYINSLKAQQAALDYISADHAKFNDEWEEAYDVRTQLLKDFVDNYGLAVSASYEGTLKDLLTNATLVNEKQDQQAAVDAICSSMQFERVEGGYGSEYATVVENTAGFDFGHFSVDISLLDADGVIVGSTYSSVDNWGAGQKAKFDFYSSEEFASVTVKSSSWDVAK